MTDFAKEAGVRTVQELVRGGAAAVAGTVLPALRRRAS